MNLITFLTINDESTYSRDHLIQGYIREEEEEEEEVDEKMEKEEKEKKTVIMVVVVVIMRVVMQVRLMKKF